MKQLNKSFLNLLVCYLILALVGCTPSSRQSMSYGLDSRPSVNHHALAKKHLRQAERSDGADAELHQLQAADHFLLAKDTSLGEDLLHQMKGAPSGPILSTYSKIVHAQLLLNKKQYAKAEQDIQHTWGIKQLPLDLRYRYYQVSAEAAYQQGKIIDAAQSRITLGHYLADAFDRKENNQAIWHMLSELTPRTLRAMQHSAGSDELSGWIAFTHMMKQYDTSSAQLARAMQVWQDRYPGHPAGQLIQQRSPAQDTHRVPTRIALLLPLHGPHAASAKAIRDGFLTAYYQKTRSGHGSAEVKVVDTTQYPNARAAYQAAVEQGSDFIVGPLRKESVAELANHNLSVPVLALNTLPNASMRGPHNFYQFGLPPEMEARTVAEKAWSDGHRKALIIVPKNQWGQRMRQSFQDHWTRMGGQVIATEAYTNATGLTDNVQRLLAVDQSEQRTKALKKLGLHINAEARRRQDVDFVFMAAKPTFARQIKPLLNFYFASNLPVYATSNVYSGHPTPKADQDINQVVFCDMPWVLDSTVHSRTTYRAIQKLWPAELQHHPRLFALGIDAYHLSQKLNQLQVFPDFSISGMTGMLRLNSSRQIERQLLWAQIVNGVPQVRGG